MENKDIHFDDATIKDIRTKLTDVGHCSSSCGDTMEDFMRRMCMDGYDDGYCDPTEIPNQ